MRGAILPAEDRQSREHPDLRLARRARTIADLARVISERQIGLGIRRTLWVQSRRLEHLARTRLKELGGIHDDTDEIVSVTVYWPSGQVQRVTDVQVDRILLVSEQ